jgi:hypothetical protein
VGQHSEGTYILRINVRDWTDEELWRTYIRLTEAESAIRIQKFDLASQDRGHEAHVLICFLAYALCKTLQQWQSKAMLGDSPHTILSELGRFTLPISSCLSRKINNANCAFAASCDLIRTEHCCSNASLSNYPSEYTCHRWCKCSGDFLNNHLIHSIPPDFAGLSSRSLSLFSAGRCKR